MEGLDTVFDCNDIFVSGGTPGLTICRAPLPLHGSGNGKAIFTRMQENEDFFSQGEFRLVLYYLNGRPYASAHCAHCDTSPRISVQHGTDCLPIKYPQ